MIKVYFPLEEGSLAEISLLRTTYPQTADYPIYIHHLEEFAPDVRHSFRTARDAAYNLLRKKKLISSKDKYAFHYNTLVSRQL